MIAFGANIDALNINWQTPLDIACNDDIRVLLISVGSDSGDIVRERLDNYKQLPPAPVISLEESGIDWRGLSQSNDATSLSSSLLPAVMNNYTAWLEWRQKQGVCSCSLHHYCLPFEIAFHVLCYYYSYCSCFVTSSDKGSHSYNDRVCSSN